ncbi:MAG: DUF402 domain-containing protein [Anaerolineae bacterium]|nr:DUF402 domain-containing protein [Anaerolineae bacterium]
MPEDLPQITIHLSRLGKPERIYREGLVEDDGVHLVTFSQVPEAASLRLSDKFHKMGRLKQGQVIASVAKHHFYREYFSILEYCDPAGSVLGHYCDIVTPLRRSGSDYYLLDLILDVWIAPDLQYVVLDRDEFAQAELEKVIDVDLAKRALNTCLWIEAEIARGDFPKAYLR